MQSKATPYLCVKDAARALEFYTRAFGATELFRLTDPADGKVGHAEIEIEGALIMLADEYPDFGVRSPLSIGGSPVRIVLQVADADAVASRAVAAGATLLRPVQDQFYGERSGNLRDPFGHEWMVSTPKERVSPEEMQRRWNAMARGS